MTGSIQSELIALSDRWRVRAKRFMSEAEQARRSPDTIRLTAMASTLEWAASDVCCLLNVPYPNTEDSEDQGQGS
jgi:hypothetical protein